MTTANDSQAPQDPLGLARHARHEPRRESLPSPIGDKGPRQCVHTRRNGTRCGRHAIVGGFVCTSHGGKAPQVVQAARERMAFLVDPCLERLWGIINDPLAEDGVVVNACRVVLDRAGLGPTSTLEATVTTNRADWERTKEIQAMSDDELTAHMREMTGRLLLLRAAERQDVANLERNTALLVETNETITEQERLGVPDRDFMEKLVALRAQLEKVLAGA